MKRSSKSRTRWLNLVVMAGMASALAVAPQAASAAEGAGEDPVVTIGAGSLRGTATATNKAFLGIPFAAPPVGNLRWKAPQPVEPWNGTRDATQPGPACAQKASPIGGLPTGTVNEDCLYLNVHTPANVRPGAKLPVMVWVHGGSYDKGAGSLYDPSALAATTNTIVVTTNYRLGALGFLSLPGLAAENPALNYGIQDQQAALRWTQRNIAAFGGDTNRVTLFGESAGAGSVCTNLVSPEAVGLFHRAILQSGTCRFNSPGEETSSDGYASGKELAERVGCPDDGGQVACMRAKSVADLQNAVQADPTQLTGGLRFSTVVDGKIVLSDPMERITSGRFHRMPIMIGTNRDEGRLFTFAAFDLRGKTLTEEQYRQLIAKQAGEQAASIVTNVYSSQRYGSPSKALSALITDSRFAYHTNKLATATSLHTPTYAYEFNDQNAPLTPAKPDLRLGAYHGAELQYLFDTPSTPLLDDKQRALSAQMMTYWANFAATGNPNRSAPGNTASAPAWPRFNALTSPYRHLTASGGPTILAPGQYSHEHNLLFWKFVAALAK